MARRKNQTPPTVSESRIAYLRGKLRTVTADAALARKAKSFSALAALHRQHQSLRDQLDTELAAREKARARVEEEERIAGLSTPELAAEIREAVGGWPDDLLVVVVDVLRERGLIPPEPVDLHLVGGA